MATTADRVAHDVFPTNPTFQEPTRTHSIVAFDLVGSVSAGQDIMFARPDYLTRCLQGFKPMAQLQDLVQRWCDTCAVPDTGTLDFLRTLGLDDAVVCALLTRSIRHLNAQQFDLKRVCRFPEAMDNDPFAKPTHIGRSKDPEPEDNEVQAELWDMADDKDDKVPTEPFDMTDNDAPDKDAPDKNNIDEVPRYTWLRDVARRMAKLGESQHIADAKVFPESWWDQTLSKDIVLARATATRRITCVVLRSRDKYVGHFYAYRGLDHPAVLFVDGLRGGLVDCLFAKSTALAQDLCALALVAVDDLVKDSYDRGDPIDEVVFIRPHHVLRDVVARTSWPDAPDTFDPDEPVLPSFLHNRLQAIQQESHATGPSWHAIIRDTKTRFVSFAMPKGFQIQTAPTAAHLYPELWVSTVGTIASTVGPVSSTVVPIVSPTPTIASTVDMVPSVTVSSVPTTVIATGPSSSVLSVPSSVPLLPPLPRSPKDPDVIDLTGLELSSPSPGVFPRTTEITLPTESRLVIDLSDEANPDETKSPAIDEDEEDEKDSGPDMNPGDTDTDDDDVGAALVKASQPVPETNPEPSSRNVLGTDLEPVNAPVSSNTVIAFSSSRDVDTTNLDLDMDLMNEDFYVNDAPVVSDNPIEQAPPEVPITTNVPKPTVVLDARAIRQASITDQDNDVEMVVAPTPSVPLIPLSIAVTSPMPPLPTSPVAPIIPTPVVLAPSSLSTRSVPIAPMVKRRLGPPTLIQPVLRGPIRSSSSSSSSALAVQPSSVADAPATPQLLPVLTAPLLTQTPSVLTAPLIAQPSPVLTAPLITQSSIPLATSDTSTIPVVTLVSTVAPLATVTFAPTVASAENKTANRVWERRDNARIPNLDGKYTVLSVFPAPPASNKNLAVLAMNLWNHLYTRMQLDDTAFLAWTHRMHAVPFDPFPAGFNVPVVHRHVVRGWSATSANATVFAAVRADLPASVTEFVRLMESKEPHRTNWHTIANALVHQTMCHDEMTVWRAPESGVLYAHYKARTRPRPGDYDVSPPLTAFELDASFVAANRLDGLMDAWHAPAGTGKYYGGLHAIVAAVDPNLDYNDEKAKQVETGGTGTVYRSKTPGLYVKVSNKTNLNAVVDRDLYGSRRMALMIPHLVRSRRSGLVPEGTPHLTPGTRFFTMDTLPGRSLEAISKKNRVTSWPVTITQAAYGLADILGQIHGLGVAHLDFTWDNVFLDDTPTLAKTPAPTYVLDFGSCFLADVGEQKSLETHTYLEWERKYKKNVAGGREVFDRYAMGVALLRAFNFNGLEMQGVRGYEWGDVKDMAPTWGELLEGLVSENPPWSTTECMAYVTENRKAMEKEAKVWFDRENTLVGLSGRPSRRKGKAVPASSETTKKSRVAPKKGKDQGKDEDEEAEGKDEDEEDLPPKSKRNTKRKK